MMEEAGLGWVVLTTGGGAKRGTRLDPCKVRPTLGGRKKKLGLNDW